MQTIALHTGQTVDGRKMYVHKTEIHPCLFYGCSPQMNRKPLANTNALSISWSKSLSKQLFRGSERGRETMLPAEAVLALAAVDEWIAIAVVGVVGLLVLS